jgi:hypothetical protein
MQPKVIFALDANDIAFVEWADGGAFGVAHDRKPIADKQWMASDRRFLMK